MIRKTTPNDTAAVIALAETNGFDPDEIELVRETLANYLDGNGNALWFTATDNDPVGVVYCAPEPMTNGTWKILMILVSPNRHRQGHGKALMNHIEETLAECGGRLIIVETSSTDGFERARAFYPKCGYREEARIRNFYDQGDDKIVYSKAINFQA